jgi:sec-independent protein translocase protein TatA
MLAGPDLLVILVIALIVFGPKKLPEIGKSIGHAMREFKKATEDMKESFEGKITELEEPKSHSTSQDPVTNLPEKTLKS